MVRNRCTLVAGEDSDWLIGSDVSSGQVICAAAAAIRLKSGHDQILVHGVTAQ